MPLRIESKSDDINLTGACDIPTSERILYVGSGLQGRVRLEGPEGLGRPLDVGRIGALPTDIGSYAIAVVDLDVVGVGGVEELRRAGFEGRIVGFFSHVNEALGAAAAAAGVEVFPRGRFWREARALLDPPGSA